MAAHRAPALQPSAMVADEESSGHTSSESDGYMQEILQDVEAEEIQMMQRRNSAQTILSDDVSIVGQAGSDASGSDESELEQPLDVLAGMASIPEGDENDAVSSHPSSAEEDKNEEPACEAYWCRCPRGCYCAGDGDCCYCERCYHEWTWCNCDCKGCRAHDLAGEAKAAEPTFTRASGDSDGTPPTRDAPARGNARASSGRSNDGAA